MDEIVKNEAIIYFGKRAFHRLFLSFKKKIESLGKVGGSVVLFPKEDERNAIESWLGLPFPGKSMTLSLKDFEKRLIGSRFEALSLWRLVELITGSPIVWNKERKEQEEKEKAAYYHSLTEKYPHPNARILIHKIVNKEKGANGFITSYNSGDRNSIEVVLKAISELPNDGEFERIPIFADRITGNPHYFEKNSKLYQALELLMSEIEKRSYRSHLNIEDESELLSIFGLAKDDLHSFVTCYGLEAFRNGEVVNQWHWANKEKTVQNIPLRAMKEIDEVRPARGNVVFIIENSGVYSSVLDKLVDDVYPVICTHGNFKLSGLLLVDKLVKSGTKLFYSGDIDIGGIKIANFLKGKYGGNVHFWRMGLEEYQYSLSQVPLSLSSMNELDYIMEPSLKELIVQMKIEKRAGYQEQLLNSFVQDIKNHLSK
jgi:uncharacterized protein (TIGR02679 family)